MTTYHVELKDRQRLFGKVKVRGGVPHWPDGEPLSGVDISYWACWRKPKQRVVPRPGEVGFQRHSRLERTGKRHTSQLPYHPGVWV